MIPPFGMYPKDVWLSPPILNELLPLGDGARFVAEFDDAPDDESWAQFFV